MTQEILVDCTHTPPLTKEIKTAGMEVQRDASKRIVFNHEINRFRLVCFVDWKEPLVGKANSSKTLVLITRGRDASDLILSLQDIRRPTGSSDR